MTEPALIGVERRGDVCVIQFQREEKLNAFSVELERQLYDAFSHESVRTSRCVVVTGSERAFSVGGDLNDFTEPTARSVVEYSRDSGRVYEGLAALTQPTIAAISGWCLGAGLELALAADLRVADRSATLGLPEVELGVVTAGATYRLARLAGPSKAKEVLLLHPRMSADVALGFGLVNEVVDAGTALTRALEMADAVCALPPLAATLATQLVDCVVESSREASVALERATYGLLAQSRDAQEATSAFLEKRQPLFTGD
jgi:enoyl-CoA hydratase/carnithine racemase